ncbi:hypothetical protein AJ78_05884, partial [Emergomyces pasteurianus Ep9510]
MSHRFSLNFPARLSLAPVDVSDSVFRFGSIGFAQSGRIFNVRRVKPASQTMTPERREK